MRRDLLGILAVSLAVRLLYVFEIRDDVLTRHLVIDAQFYHQWALRIAGGDWLGSEAFYQDPLYAYLLAAVYKALWPSASLARWLQAALDTATVWLIFLLTRRLFGRRAGLFAAGLAAVYGPMVYYVGLLDKTCVSSFLVAASLAAFVWARDAAAPSTAAASGALFGLTALIRGNMLIAAAVMAARLSPRRAGLFVCGAGLVVGAVFARNFFVGKDAVLLTSNAGLNFLIGNNPYTAGAYSQPPFVRGIPEFEYADSKAYAESVARRSLKPSEVSRFFFSQGLAFIRENPRELAAVAVKKVFLLFNGFEIPETYSYYYFRSKYASLKLCLVDFRLLAPLGIVGAFAALRAPGARELHLFLLAYGASVVAFFVTSRYRFPIAIALFPFAGRLVDELLARWTLPAPAFVKRSFAALAAAAALCWWVPPWMADRVVGVGLSTPHMVAGYVLKDERGDIPGAIREFEKALSIRPSSPTYLYLAETYSAAGDDRKALDNYAEALRRDPMNHEAANNMGVILFKHKDYGAAARAFELAARLKPYEPSYQRNSSAAKKAAGAALR